MEGRFTPMPLSSAAAARATLSALRRGVRGGAGEAESGGGAGMGPGQGSTTTARFSTLHPLERKQAHLAASVKLE